MTGAIKIYNPSKSLFKKGASGGWFYFRGDSSETDSLWRPFLRRLARTLRPLAVCMRLRKPWTVLRRRVCGWNVRFIFNFFSLLTQLENAAPVEKQAANSIITTGHHARRLWKGGKGNRIISFLKHPPVIFGFRHRGAVTEYFGHKIWWHDYQSLPWNQW